MSIAPIDSFSAVSNQQLENANASSGSAQSRSQQSAAPVSGTLPEQESSVATNVPSAYKLPEDVVEVHQDPDIKGQIIVQYLDQTGSVIVQVPNTEELSVERGIAEEFEASAKLSAVVAKASPEREGEKSRGN